MHCRLLDFRVVHFHVQVLRQSEEFEKVSFEATSKHSEELDQVEVEEHFKFSGQNGRMLIDGC